MNVKSTIILNWRPMLIALGRIRSSRKFFFALNCDNASSTPCLFDKRPHRPNQFELRIASHRDVQHPINLRIAHHQMIVPSTNISRLTASGKDVTDFQSQVTLCSSYQRQPTYICNQRCLLFAERAHNAGTPILH